MAETQKICGGILESLEILYIVLSIYTLYVSTLLFLMRKVPVFRCKFYAKPQI